AAPHVTAIRGDPSAATWNPGTRSRISVTQPSTSRAIGPAWSKLVASGNTPSTGTSPKLGLNPTTPQHAAGVRIGPPGSGPRAPATSPRASAAAEPPADPP